VYKRGGNVCMAANTLREKNRELIEKMWSDPQAGKIAAKWFNVMLGYKYHYRFSWLGRPIIQLPQDIIAMQEIIWQVKPDLIIETGIAHGGSLILSASMLELIGKNGRALGIDIDIRHENRTKIEQHPMFKRITMIEGSSIDMYTFQQVTKIAKAKKNIMVILDSMHTHNHVLQELRLYSSLVSKNSYLIVFDTVIEDIPDKISKDRPWGKDNNPKTAVREFLKENDKFILDEEIDRKLFITVAPGGFLKRI